MLSDFPVCSCPVVGSTGEPTGAIDVCCKVHGSESGFETCPSTTPARRNGAHACNLPKGHTGPHRSVYGSGWTNKHEPSLDDRLAAKLQRQRQGIIDPILFKRGVTDPDGANLKDGTAFDAETGERKPEFVPCGYCGACSADAPCKDRRMEPKPIMRCERCGESDDVVDMNRTGKCLNVECCANRVMRERDEWQRIAQQKSEELTTALTAGTTAARRCMDAEAALQRIADMPTTPRPDGTYNYDRNALVQIARIALGRSDA